MSDINYISVCKCIFHLGIAFKIHSF
jgi:hypothetical protein